MSSLLALTALAALVALALGAHGVARLRRRRLFTGGAESLTAVALLGLSAALAALALNLHTYERLTYERPLAELEFTRLAPQRFRAVVRYANGERSAALELYGDEWQLDARILKWRGIANVLGLDARYRIERLSGRYADVEQERSHPRSAHRLASDAGLDAWALARRYERWLPLADALYGSATYLPMADGARFAVRVTQSGLIARPLNDAARRAIAQWS